MEELQGRRCRHRRRRHLEVQVDIQASKTIFVVFNIDFDTYESSREFETGVLHRISSRIDLAECLAWGAI